MGVACCFFYREADMSDRLKFDSSKKTLKKKNEKDYWSLLLFYFWIYLLNKNDERERRHIASIYSDLCKCAG